MILRLDDHPESFGRKYMIEKLSGRGPVAGSAKELCGKWGQHRRSRRAYARGGVKGEDGKGVANIWPNGAYLMMAAGGFSLVVRLHKGISRGKRATSLVPFRVTQCSASGGDL